MTINLDDIKNNKCTLSCESIEALVNNQKSGCPYVLAVIESNGSKSYYDALRLNSFLKSKNILVHPNDESLKVTSVTYIWNRHAQSTFTEIGTLSAGLNPLLDNQLLSTYTDTATVCQEQNIALRLDNLITIATTELKKDKNQNEITFLTKLIDDEIEYYLSAHKDGIKILKLIAEYFQTGTSKLDKPVIYNKLALAYQNDKSSGLGNSFRQSGNQGALNMHRRAFYALNPKVESKEYFLIAAQAINYDVSLIKDFLWKKNRDAMLEVVKNFNYLANWVVPIDPTHIGKDEFHFSTDLGFMKECCQHANGESYLPFFQLDKMKSDKEYSATVLDILKKNGRCISAFQDQEEAVGKALSEFPEAFMFMAPNLRNDISTLTKMITKTKQKNMFNYADATTRILDDNVVQIKSHTKDYPFVITKAHKHQIIVCSPYGDDKLLTCSFDKTVRLWNTKTWESQEICSHPEHEIRDVQVVGPGIIATASWDETVKVVNVDKGSVLHELKHKSKINCVAGRLNENGNIIIRSGCRNGTFYTFELPKDGGQPTSVITTANENFKNGTVFSICNLTSFKGDYFVTGCGDGTVTIWNGNGKQPTKVMQWKAHDDAIRCIIECPHGIATCSKDKKIKIWKLHDPMTIESGQSLYDLDDTLDGHAEEVLYLFLMQDKSLLSSSKDSTVKLWRYKDGKWRLNMNFGGHVDWARCASQLPDGKIVTVGADTTMRVYDLSQIQESDYIELSLDKVALDLDR